MVLEQWRHTIAAALRSGGTENALTHRIHPHFGRTFITTLSTTPGRYLRVWWSLQNDETALVLAATEQDEPDDSDTEFPPEQE